MEYRMAMSLCLLLAVVPLAAGLECYSCKGSSVGDAANNCVDAVLANLEKDKCPSPPAGQVAKCKQERTRSTNGGVETTTITRSCAQQKSDAPDECDESSSSPKGVDIDTETCYCSEDKCNGQTVLSPAIITCFVSLFLAIIALF